MTKYSTDGTLAGFIEQKIKDMFGELAEFISSADMSEDESAGIPMTIFLAENHMLAAWRSYTASLSEPDNLKQTNNGKETDRGPGLSGSERAAEVWDAITSSDAQKLAGLAVERMAGDLQVAEVEYHVYECGHGEIAVKGGAYHPLCPKCDDAMADGVLDEDGRFQKWLRRKHEGVY